MPVVRMILAAAILTVAGGCAAKPRLKAYVGELPPEQLSELLLDTRVRLVSVDGKQFPGATDDEASEKTRALAEAREIDETNSYPRRYVQIPAGEHEVVFGLARHIVPVKRETHIALVLITGDATYTQKLYPGSSEQIAFRLPTKPKRTYSVYPSFSRPKGGGETWTFKIRDTDSSKPVAVEIGRSKANGGTTLSPGDWAEAERAKMDADKAKLDASKKSEAKK